MSKLSTLRRLFTLAIVTMIAGAVLFSTIDNAYAVSKKPTGNTARSGELISKTADGEEITCSDYGVLLGAMVPCIMKTVEETGVKMAEEFIDMLMPVVWAFITLSVTLFGLKVLQGEGQIGPKALLFIIKIAFVIGFLQIMPNLIPLAHEIMKEINQLLAGILADSGKFNCEVSNYMKADTELLWAQMDCLLGKLFGFIVSDGSDQPNMLLAASGLGLLGGFLFSGTVGVFIFFAILGVLWSLLMFVVKTFLAYVNGFIIVAILIIVSPIFLPLAIMQVTAQYFDKWWKGILASILMPLLVTGYVIMALMVYDKLLLGDHSTVKKLFDHDYMQTLQVMTQQNCGASTGNDQDAGQAMSGGSLIDLVSDPNFRMPSNLTSSGNTAPCIEVSTLRMAADELEHLFIELVSLFITTMIISEGFKQIQQMVRTITGSSMATTGTDTVSSMEKKVESAFQSGRQGMLHATNDEGQDVGQMRGADFVANVPHIMRSGIEGFAQEIVGPGAISRGRGQGEGGHTDYVDQISGILNTDNSLTQEQRDELNRLRGQVRAGMVADPQEAINRITGGH